MISSAIPAAVFWLALGLVAYHHVLYPLITRYGARLLRAIKAPQPVIPVERALPDITIVVPAYNEAAFIEQKIKNLAALDYPADKLRIIIVNDGSTDQTLDLARKASHKAVHLDVDLRDYSENSGKVAVLNRVMRDITTDIVVFSDVSSAVDSDILKRFAGHFSDEKVGVICGAYHLDSPSNEGERAYWDFQIALKRDEAMFGEMMGAHGAFYAIRAGLFEPLEADTINDDFIIPMQIVEKGYRTVYDPVVMVREMETSDLKQDFQRRIRLSQGSMQQFMRLGGLLDPRRPGVAFVFASGKMLRALVPFLLVAMGVTGFVLMMMGDAFYRLPLIGLAILFALALLHLQDNLACIPKRLHWLAYLAAGHLAGLIGGTRYLFEMTKLSESRAGYVSSQDDAMQMGFISPATRSGKRAFDLVVASGFFIVFVLLLPFIALAIRLDTSGPIFYRQMRVGARCDTHSKLFMLIKFRTMALDAEEGTGAIWAQKNDARITRVGHFLRKTRLDELPQCLNVLRGDMSIVGPRPERSVFFARLEKEIPFYCERTYGLRPGITGLAQVTVGYDECVEDVRQKVLHDHVYATRLGRLMEWVRTDFSICFRTFSVVVLGKGQ